MAQVEGEKGVEVLGNGLPMEKQKFIYCPQSQSIRVNIVTSVIPGSKRESEARESSSVKYLMKAL